MKIIKNLMTTAAIAAFLFCLSTEASAQKKRQPVKKRASAVKTATAAANAAEIKSSAEKVSIQLKNVTRFIYVLGGVAKTIEQIDKESSSGKVSKTTVERNDLYKQTVIQSIRNLSAGLAALEVEFRVRPALRNYNLHIQGIADMSGQAEDLAAEGKVSDAGKVLLAVIEKLSDTLAMLP